MKTSFAVLFAASALATPGIASAQDAASAESANKDQGGLEEIIVTAQKRAEGLSDVPISISAVSGKQVESYGQTNLEQISSSVPNLKITQTAIANRIAIRGIASGDNKGFEQSVAMFVDGVYYGRDQLSRLPLVDMERVEVLRGPQPTLFGKNAIAGAVNITTRSPTDEFEGSVSGLYEFNHKEFQLTGVLSGPLSDGIEARVVGYHRSMDGYFYNQELDRNEPNVDEYYFRGKLELDRGGPFAAELKLEYADFEMKGQPRDVFGAVGNYNAVFQGPFFVSTDPDYVREDNGYESKNKVFGATLNADLEIGEHTLTSVSSLLDYKTREIVDVDFSGISFLDGTNLREDYRQFSQELRLASPGGEAFNYIAGVYYQHAKLDVQDFTLFNPTFLALGPPFSALGDTSNDRDYAQKSDLVSAFAQGELSVTDQLRVTAGARFNHEKKSGSRSLAIVQGPLSTAPAPVVAAVFRALNIEAHSISGKISEDSFNPMVNIQYDATDDLMLYASYAKGTKAGGFDIRSNSLPTSTTVAKPGAFEFEDESADNFEAGLKYKGRNVAFNLSVYRTDYKDLQVNIFDGTLNFNVRNAAEARTQGVEADFRAALAPGLTVSGAVAYLDFKFSNFTDGQCYYLQTPGANGFCDYSGKRNALSPKWSGNLNVDYTTPVTSDMKVAFNVNADFSSSYIAAANLDPRTHQDGYVKLGARLALAEVDDRWEVALIGRNLTNQRILQTGSSMPLATTITGNAGNAYNGIVDRPRTIAVQLTGRF
ncbi:outer membrane receptor protein involved in Fe transport [Sphingopyxis italica]|uniref:Outer membrane receptor protein involved in Fe transport n=1 Tax=Sphingopyxis italica TaxID=1129133 RepID=A0A7X6B7Y7_9SPHN|nr:TonB-dependent receptor [Sphingopyxis italica]NJB87903.1 outer membrane receptor protein involved in Fe transport [Sphingopyxis italica]